MAPPAPDTRPAGTAPTEPAAGDQDRLDETLNESFPASDPGPGPADALPWPVERRSAG